MDHPLHVEATNGDEPLEHVADERVLDLDSESASFEVFA